jgi:hypothetical protein
MTVEQFAPLMFAGLIIVMLIGFPVAFSLSGLGLFCGLYAVHMGWFPSNFLGNLPANVFGILSNDLLLAIPFFTLMGTLLEKCGLAEDMLDSMGQLFGPMRGGLGYSVIIVGFILGAITGTGGTLDGVFHRLKHDRFVDQLFAGDRVGNGKKLSLIGRDGVGHGSYLSTEITSAPSAESGAVALMSASVSNNLPVPITE